jgi:hypothetical protein
MRRLVLSALLFAALSGIMGPAKAADRVGYVGCSMTKNAVEGYHAIGGQKFWPVIQSYGGGSVYWWARGIGKNDVMWNDFKAYLAAQPPSKIWVQWCTRAGESQQLNQQSALKVIAEIKRLAPGVPIYVSAQPGYYLPHSCSVSGIDGPLRMELLARQTVALPGPDMGDLKSKYQAPSIPPGDETHPDGCHANPFGRETVLGPRLKAFFG